MQHPIDAVGYGASRESGTAQQDPKAFRLFHGTTRANARKIQAGGFKLPALPSYVGRAICLTPNISVAYEYGAIENGAVVLDCRLKASALTTPPPHRYQEQPFPDLAKYCNAQSCDAMWAWNMWVVHNPAVIEVVGIVPHPNALDLLTQEFNANGPQIGYNGRTADYAELWWDEHPIDTDFDKLIVKRLAAHSDYAAHLQRLRAQALATA